MEPNVETPDAVYARGEKRLSLLSAATEVTPGSSATMGAVGWPGPPLNIAGFGPTEPAIPSSGRRRRWMARRISVRTFDIVGLVPGGERSRENLSESEGALTDVALWECTMDVSL